MTRYKLFGIALGLCAILFAFEVPAHPCNKGTKRAHCFCKVTHKGAELARTVHHGDCYNQQTNLNLSSPCAKYCRAEWSNSLEPATRTTMIAKGLCGKRTGFRNYSAGTNPYVSLGGATLTAC